MHLNLKRGFWVITIPDVSVGFVELHSVHIEHQNFFLIYSFDASEQQCGQQPLLPVCEVLGHTGPEVSDLGFKIEIKLRTYTADM